MQGLYYGTTEVTERRGGKGEDVTALTHQEDEARMKEETSDKEKDMDLRESLGHTDTTWSLAMMK